MMLGTWSLSESLPVSLARLCLSGILILRIYELQKVNDIILQNCKNKICNGASCLNL